MSRLEHIRNFCIIAHIDHGKSTLADRMMELTETITKRQLHEQMLDDMDLERERGITIKAHPVTMNYKAEDGQIYQFNLIDTPGHVDFSYEVTRSLSACEGAILIVDAAQGVEAQTVANTYLAMGNDLVIIPVLNKIDLPNANVEEVSQQIEEILAIPTDDSFNVSAKTGVGVEAVLEAIVQRIPPPKEKGEDGTTRALIFDSVFDAYRGVISYIRVVDGELKAGDKIRLMSANRNADVKEVGIFTPKPFAMPVLRAGEVGYLIGNIKDPHEIHIGDTITKTNPPAKEPLPGFKEIRPMVFAGLYPVVSADYEKLRTSLDKLKLNDSSFQFQAESSVALGFGFRCGFLGLLHMEIIQERLRREYDLDIISTYPNVVYHVFKTDGEMTEVDNPIYLPDPSEIEHIEEPIIKAFIICHNENIGDIMQLMLERRGEVETTDSLDKRRVMMTCKVPLNEILLDFHDKLKSISKGYASMDYEHAGYETGDLVKMDILVHGEMVEAFSCIIERSKAVGRGRQMCKALREIIPSQQFAVAIQAAIGNNVIARENVRAFRKDVIAKCYGGDVTRKRKLLEKQKDGKKRMKQVGQVSIPQEAFVAVLKATD